MEDEPVNRSATLAAPRRSAEPVRADAGEDVETRSGHSTRFLAGIERRAFRIASMALRDRAEAEDAVQDAMIRLVRSYGRPSGRRVAAAFLPDPE